MFPGRIEVVILFLSELKGNKNKTHLLRNKEAKNVSQKPQSEFY